MSMKNSNDTIENQSRDFPVCSAVPQSLRYGMPQVEVVGWNFPTQNERNQKRKSVKWPVF
jgi:hypothetical protein